MKMIVNIKYLFIIFIVFGENLKVNTWIIRTTENGNGFPPSDCCFQKDVGGIQYTLAAEEDTSAYGCENNCSYTRDWSEQSRFCFKTGNLSFHCSDDDDNSYYYHNWGESVGISGLPVAETRGNPQLEITKYHRPTPPPLRMGQTRIILSWPDKPNDLDIHVRGFQDKKETVLDGDNACHVYYSDKCGCPSVCLDVDNTAGGSNGQETVTLQNAKENKNFVYAIGVHEFTGQTGNSYGYSYDYGYGYDYGPVYGQYGSSTSSDNNDDSFGSSQTKITIVNGNTSISTTLPISDVGVSGWWFFGCISVSADKELSIYSAPNATTFNGQSLSSWTDMVVTYCNIIVQEGERTAVGQEDMPDFIDLPPRK